MYFKVTRHDPKYVYDGIRNLKANIEKLVLTDEVNELQKAKLREYIRTLRRRMDKIETRISYDINFKELEIRPKHVPTGCGC